MPTDRQKRILGMIVDDYVRLASPVASETIARNAKLGVSSATIRNDVAQLEEDGYLTRPHASAGSVPLDKGYRMYVETLVPGSGSRISEQIRSDVRRQLIDAERDVEAWAGVAAAALAGLVDNLAVATFPKAKQSRVKHLELVYLQDFLALLIVVLEQARLRRHLIRLKSPIDPGQLEETTSKLKPYLVGMTRGEIQEMEVKTVGPLEEELVEATSLILAEEDQANYTDHYVDGLRRLFSQPEFTRSDMLRYVVERVEDGSLVQAILDETPEGGSIRVVIGREHHEHWGDVLSPFSVVVCQYGIPGEAEGVVAALGPTRMEYPKTIDGVTFLSTVMTELVSGVSGG